MQTLRKPFRILTIAGLMLFASQSAAIGQAESGQASVPEPTYAFGTVKQGEIVTHTFVIRNSRAAPLKIERMELSRQGLTARAKPEIPPGEEGKIAVRWDTSRMKGEVSGQVVVHLADPGQPPIVLLLKGLVKPLLDVVPSRAVFIRVFKGESAEQTVTVINNDARALAITRLEPLGGHFHADVRAVEPGKVYQVAVKVPPETPPGRYLEALNVHTDHPDHSPIRIAVNVLVRTELYTFPDSVDFGTVSLAELARKPSLVDALTQFLLVKKRDGDFEIRSVASDFPFLRISQDPVGRKSGTFRLDVGLDREKLEPGKLNGSLRIRTDSAEFPELVVPIRGELK